MFVAKSIMPFAHWVHFIFLDFCSLYLYQMPNTRTLVKTLNIYKILHTNSQMHATMRVQFRGLVTFESIDFLVCLFH